MSYLPHKLGAISLPPNPLWGHYIRPVTPPVALSAALCLLPNWAEVGGADPFGDSVLPLRSQRFDADYLRMILTTVDSKVVSSCWYGKGRFWEPGMLSGVWGGQGSVSIITLFEFIASYRSPLSSSRYLPF